jgi:hypothetical protein
MEERSSEELLLDDNFAGIVGIIDVPSHIHAVFTPAVIFGCLI